MSDPTAAAATAAGAGVGALILSTLGVEPQALLWGALGAAFGLAASPPPHLIDQSQLTGRMLKRARGLLIFGLVVMLSALAGTYIAHEYAAGRDIARNASAAVVGAFFHPIFNAVGNGIPALMQRLLERIGGARP